MKKVITSISVLAAIAAITLASCQKEDIRPESTVETHTVKILPTTTKTVIGSEVDGKTTIKWTTNEKVYAYENDNTAIEAVLVSEDEGATATIMATFEKKAADSYKYHAIVANSVSNSQNPLLPSEQTATATSYDSDADILISSVSEPFAEPAEEISLYFARPVVINKMTLKDLTEGEKIKSVEFTASCNLAGRIKPNFETGNIADYGVSETKKTIKVTYANNETASSEGTFPVYFVTFPTLTEAGCGDFSVVVRTNKYVYTKNVSGKNLEFKLDQKTDFKLGLADAQKEEVLEDVVYTLVNSTSDLFDGAEYIIAAAGSDCAMGHWGGGNNHPQISITKVTSDNVTTITTNNASGVLPVRISKEEEKNNVTYYSLVNASSDSYKDYYLVKESGGNYLKEDNATLGDTGKWTISINEGKATITNKGASSYTIRYNSNSSLFAAYTSGQADVALYVNKATCIEKVGDPNLTVTQTGANEVTARWTAVNNAVDYELYFGNEKKEGYTQDGDNNYSYVFGELTVGETYTFKVVVKADAGYKDNTVTKELTLANLQLVNPTPDISDNSITSNSFEVTWDAVENAGSYAYYVTKNNERISGYESDKTTDETTVTIVGLDAATAYVFHIKTKKLEESAFIEPTEYATASATTLAQDVTIVWKKVSSITDGEYIIVNNSKYLPSTTTSSSPAQKAITIVSNKVTSTIADDMIWNIAIGTDSKLTIKNSEGKYLYETSSSTGLRVGTTSDTWTLEENGDGFAIKGTNNDKYCATYSSGSDWRSYGSKDHSNYGDGGKLYFYKRTADVPATPLSAPANLICSVSGEDFLTFTWDEVSNADGYQVSTDGTNYGDTITETSYTLNNLTASTPYTLYVKAIGDGETYSDSEASSASGTTTAPISWVLDGIEVTKQPTKKEYTTSESFDPTGMVVTATYKADGFDDKVVDIPLKDGDKDGYTYSPTGNLTTDVTKITITYQEKTAEVTGITVTASQPVYKLVGADEITEGTYVIGALRSSTATNKFYFATGAISSGDMTVSENSVTIEEKNGVRSFNTSSLPTGAVEFTFTGNNTNGFKIATGGKYLGYTAASNRKLAFDSKYSTYLWTISAKSSPLIAKGVVIKHKGDQSYTISENSTGTGAIRGYAGATEYRAIYIFKKVNN